MPRNSSGTYSLPAGNPVVSGTLIETNWANPTMSDIGSSITDSLDRFGRGGMLAQLKLADGTLAAPAFAFNSEASTGFYRPAAATLNLSVLGSLVASFTSTAITFSKPVTFTGAITLSAVLAWFGGTAALPGLAVAGDLDTGFYSIAANTVGVSTAGVSRLVWDAAGNTATSGNLGVAGTPALPLDVFTATAGDKLRVRNTVSTFETKLGISVDSGYIDSSNTDFAMRVNGTERARITLAGRFGIGRTPVSTLLEVAGTIQAIGAAVSDVSFAASATAIGAHATGFNNSGVTNAYGAPTGTAYLAIANVFPLVFTTSAVERMRIDAAGLVGINRTPSYRLDSLTNVTGAKLFRFSATGGVDLFGHSDGGGSGITNSDPQSGGAMVYMGGTTVQNYTGGTLRTTVDASGRFGIAVTPSYILDVLAPASGAKLFRFTAAGAASLFGYTDAGGAGITNADPQSGGSMVYLAGQLIELYTAGGERARIDSAGLFMIARTTNFGGTRFKLQVGDGAGATAILSHSSDQFAIGVAQGAGTGVFFLGARNAVAVPDLQFSNNAGVARFVMTEDGRFYGSALHNNAGAITGTTNQYVASGTYTPTFTIVANVTAPGLAAGTAKWMRVGNVVTVSLWFIATMAANSVTASVGISLPIASNLVNVGDLAGAATFRGSVAANSTALAGTVSGDTANDRAQLDWTLLAASNGNPQNFGIIFQYEVL